MKRAGILTVLMSMLTSTAAFTQQEGVAAPQPAYRVGTTSPRVALLPVRCSRDMDRSLCSVLDETLGVHLSRDPRLDVIGPRDLEALMGGQQLLALASCEGDACFGSNVNSVASIQASYMLSVAVGRLGTDALITARLVDLSRGIIIDRDDARVSRGSENAIDQATRELVETVLIRRGLGTPRVAGVDDDEGSPAVFWGGVVLTGISGVALATAGGLGTLAFVNAQSLAVSKDVARSDYDATAGTARGFALGSDAALIGGGALLTAGITMMVLGSF